MKYLFSDAEIHVNPSFLLKFMKNDFGTYFTNILIFLSNLLLGIKLINDNLLGFGIILPFTLVLSLLFYKLSQITIESADILILKKYHLLSKQKITRFLIWFSLWFDFLGSLLLIFL